MFFKKIPFCLGLTFLTLFALSACGGDSSSGSDSPEKPDNVSSLNKLPDCTDDFEGDTVFVKDVKADYACKNGEWVNLDSSEAVPHRDSEPSSSTVSEESSSATQVDDDKSSSSESSSSVVTTDMTIKGVSQKGPFIKGAKIKIQELDGGRGLNQTGSTFSTVIQDNDGKFKLNARSMVSQYIELQAEGYYRNEVTGESSDAPLTLLALTDVSMRDGGVVNINLLTHLEYFRVIDLVKKGKKKVFEAKDQAQGEILNAFYIKGDFESSEDLDIFSKGDGNAALLAISILMQHNLDVADLTELMTDFASDIEDDGLWDDETAKAKIADWASEQDLSGGLEKIRTNVSNWKLGPVPDFEKYVRHFWYTNYGLGDCDTEGKILATQNSRSVNHGTNVRYICKSGAWVEASAIEKDTDQWKDGEDGEIKKGSITDAKYKYDVQLKKWIAATDNDVALGLGGCTTNKVGTLLHSSTDDTYYICRDMDWEAAQEIDYETNGYVCSATNVGETIAGVVTPANKYYCTASGWILIPMNWSWDVPKEARLNPTITYETFTESAERGGRTYKTVVIGTGENVQTWMAENLNYATDNSWCYNDIASNCDVAGRLYSWAAAIDSATLYKEQELDCGYKKDCSETLPSKVQGVCPRGWHLPTKAEWEKLFENVGSSTAAKILKSQTGWCSGCNGEDTFGFSALPAGNRVSAENYQHVGSFAYFWSATETSTERASYVQIQVDYSKPNLNADNKYYGYSVRCVKD